MTVARTYEDLRDETPGPHGTAWPEAFVPLVGDEAARECVDLATGAIFEYDGEELLERWDPGEPKAAAPERGWKACCSTRALSVGAWPQTVGRADSILRAARFRMAKTRHIRAAFMVSTA